MLTLMGRSEFLSILALAIGLGCDAFAVGLSIGARWGSPRQTLRLSFHFGLFQFLMPLLGWGLGQRVLLRLLGPVQWLGAAILALVGLKMLTDTLRGSPGTALQAGAPVPSSGALPSGATAPSAPSPKSRTSYDPTRGWSLVVLSVATSLDALAVGIGMGIAGARLVLPAGVIGVTAALMTFVAMRLGQTLSRRAGRRMEILGALLILAAAAMLLR